MLVELRKVKTFPGREGHALDCELWVDGKLAGGYHDDASGGGGEFMEGEWYDEAGKKRVGNKPLFEKLLLGVQQIPVKPDAEAWERDLKPRSRLEILVGDAVSDHADNKQMFRACQKGIVFHRASDKPHAFWTTKLPFTAENAATLRKKYPDLDVIYNEDPKVINPTKYPTFEAPDPQAGK